MKDYKYIIFDFDGTLVDSMWLWDDLDTQLLARRGIIPDKFARDKVKKINLKQSAEFFIEYFKLKSDTVQGLCNEMSEMASHKYKYDVPLKPAVMGILEMYRQQGKRMCIATVSDRKNVEHVIKKYNMSHYFEFIFTSEDVSEGKTSPEIFLKCASEFGVDPEQIMVFEDSLHAIETVKKEGFYAVAMYDKTSDQNKEKMNAISDEFLNSFEEILECK